MNVQPADVRRLAAWRAGLAPLSLLLAAAWLQPQPLLGLAEVAGGDLTLSTTLSLAWDSDTSGGVDADGNEEDDISFSLSPTLRWSRDEGRGSIDAFIGMTLTKYRDIEEDDYNDFNAGLNIGFPFKEGSKLSGGGNLGFARTTDIQEDIDARATTDNYNAGVNFGYRLSSKVGLTFSGNYSYSTVEEVFDVAEIVLAPDDPANPTPGMEFVVPAGTEEDFNDVSSYGGGVSVSFALRPTFGLFTSYNIGVSEVDGNEDQEGFENISHSWSVGFSKPITEKLSGSLSLGLQYTDAGDPEVDNFANWTANGSLSWQAREKTAMNLSLNRSAGISSDADTTITTGASVGVSQQFTQKLSGNLNFGMTYVEIDGLSAREIYSYTAGLSFSYTFTKQWSASLSYGFTYSDREDYFERIVLNEFDPPVELSRLVETEDTRRHIVTLSTTYVF